MKVRKTNNIFLLLFILFGSVLIGSISAYACNGGCFCEVASASFDLVRSSVTADTLVNLINNVPDIALLECRSIKQKENITIPNAKVLYEDDDLKNISEIVPATDTLIILFPGIEKVEIASMSQNLKELGYVSVLEYPDGVFGWMTYGYETEGEN